MFLMHTIMLLVVYLSAMVVLVCVKKDISIANFTWGGGVLLLTLYTFFASSFLGDNYDRSLLVTLLITIWAVRMIAHLYHRYTGKDPRFTTWKTEGGLKSVIIHSLYIFGPQLVLLLIMSVPSVMVNISPMQPALGLLDFIGLGLWVIGFGWEAIADYQLYRFMRHTSHDGKIMRAGLWRYSRHPNYFGEVVMWWALFLIASSANIFAIISPITITILLLFVTGIPLVERALNNNLQFQEYKRKTSAFFPWFPGK